MTADICVFVEGTYPYVMGGVSAWLHRLIGNLPEFTFTILHLGSKPEPGRIAKYQLPPNVIGFQEVFLNSPSSLPRSSTSRRSSQRWQSLRAFHDALAGQNLEEGIDILRSIFEPGADRLDVADLLYAQEAWGLLVDRYQTNAPSTPFLNYFWTFRSTHLPLFVLNDTPFPAAKLYHTVSTGYAGYAAALAKLRTGMPLLITEHGIYTRERDMEIALASWIDSVAHKSYRIDAHTGIFKAWWTNMFRFMSKFTYEMCDSIISITKRNQQYQIRDGAESSKLRLIPNGIDADRFSRLRAERHPDPDNFTVGFVGRVVPIKDVKCFIQAVKMASATIPGIRALVIGPTDEDPEYFAECEELIRLLELEEIIRFTGRSNVLQYYPKMDVVVLTSLSEAQPLVVLEANCAGIPVVASDVGACRDLLEGITAEDQALGASGLLTLPASPHETAQAITRLWEDESLRAQMARAGAERVTLYYREDTMYAAYRDLYRSTLDHAQNAGGTHRIWQA